MSDSPRSGRVFPGIRRPLDELRLARTKVSKDPLPSRKSPGATSPSKGSAVRKKQIPTAAWFVSFNDGRNHTVEESSYLDLRYEKDLPDGANVLARTYFDHYHYEGDYTYPPDVNKDSGDGLSWGAELKGDKTILERHRVTVGAEFRNDFRKDQENYSVGAPAPNPIRDHPPKHGGVPAGRVPYPPELILNAGVRYDHYGAFCARRTPFGAELDAPAVDGCQSAVRAAFRYRTLTN
jgi:iron complex outermembrane receptor protein